MANIFNRLITLVLTLLVPLGMKFNFSQHYDSYRNIFPQGGVRTSDKELFYDFAYPTEKLKPTDNLGNDAEFAILMAKNETEGCQLSVCSCTDGKAFALCVSDAKNVDGDTLPVSLWKEAYLDIENKGDIFSSEYPDPLIPYSGESVALEKKRSQTFYMEFRADKDTAAGKYVSEVKLSDERGNCVKETKITVTVWDFALPDKSASASAVGLNGSIFPQAAGLPYDVYGTNTWLTFYDGSSVLSSAQEEVYKKYYDCLLEHNLCAFFLPYDLLDPRAEEYMNDPRVTSFCIPYPKYDDQKLQSYYEKVTSNQLWADKAYFYPVDEPFDADRIENYDAIMERLQHLCPGCHIVVPFGDYTVIDNNGNTRTATGIEENIVDTLCPIIDYIGRIRPWLNERLSQGDRLWWYVCCGPSDGSGYCNLFTYQNGLKHRILFWQQRMQNVEGFLYYETCNWGFAGDPWTNPVTYGAAVNTDEAGDGLLLYPGNKIDTTDPVVSLRLKDVRDGMEDYDLLTLAKEKLGDAETELLIRSVTPIMTHYTQNPEIFFAVRAVIGNRLASAE